MAEIQAGNNETLISLFEIQCEEKTHVGCVSRGSSFVCGCHAYVCDGMDQAGGGDDVDEIEVDSVDETKPILGESRTIKGADFRFQRFRFPRCRAGYHMKCCSYLGKSHCFCAGNSGCPNK
jgi:hypothetical protein